MVHASAGTMPQAGGDSFIYLSTMGYYFCWTLSSVADLGYYYQRSRIKLLMSDEILLCYSLGLHTVKYELPKA